MYRIVKSKYQEGYAIHKVSKISGDEIYIDSDSLIKGRSIAELKKICISLTSALSFPVLDKSDTIVLHKTTWNENEIPFYEDVVDDILEEEFTSEYTFEDEDKAHSRW